MENEQMNPSYKELVQAYNQLVNEYQQLKIELDSCKNNNIKEKVNMLIYIVDSFKNCHDKDSQKIVKSAKWNLNKMLEKPKK